MIKCIYVIIMIILGAIFYYYPKMLWYKSHPRKYSARDRYELFREGIRTLDRIAFSTTVSSGQENLPKDTPYIMFPNHQGKYDVPGIISQNDDLCSFVLASAYKRIPFVTGICKFLNAKPMSVSSKRDALKIMAEVHDEMKNGWSYIIFSEGPHGFNKNTTMEFKPGTFKFATRAKVPIVPVALIDTYKVFHNNKFFEKVTPQVHFLKPIYYEEYKDMSTIQIAKIVKSQIDECIAKNSTEQ